MNLIQSITGDEERDKTPSIKIHERYGTSAINMNGLLSVIDAMSGSMGSVQLETFSVPDERVDGIIGDVENNNTRINILENANRELTTRVAILEAQLAELRERLL